MVVGGFFFALQSMKAQMLNRSFGIAEKAIARQGKSRKGIFMLLSQNDLKSLLLHFDMYLVTSNNCSSTAFEKIYFNGSNRFHQKRP